MQKTENYGLNRPEATDFYDVEHFNENMDILDAKMKDIESIANPDAIKDHIEDTENPHEVTKDQVGLGNVPNVSTNNQTPTYTMPSTLTAMESGEKVSTAFGKIAKVIYNFMNTPLTSPSSTADHQTEIMKSVPLWLQTLMDDIYKKPSFNAIYPVGSIYMSVNNVNPSALFGGTWEEWGGGRVPVGVDISDTNFATVEKTGGASTVTLTINQIPSHKHRQSAINLADNPIGSGGLYDFECSGSNLTQYSNNKTQQTNVYTVANGGGQAHTNLQPYITCYMWKRTA